MHIMNSVMIFPIMIDRTTVLVGNNLDLLPGITVHNPELSF
jgi:hypothetical protein